MNTEDIIVENEEFVKDSSGNISQIEGAPLHDDDMLYTSSNGGGYARVNSGNGGVLLSDISSVISSTKRSSKSGLGGRLDELIRITPLDMLEISRKFGFGLKKPAKWLSPALALKMLYDQKDVLRKRYGKSIEDDGSFEYQNTISCHIAILESLPSDEMLYDIIFEVQQSKKVLHPLDKYL